MEPTDVLGDRPAPGPPPGEVVVYWRPGCPWCALLRRRLRRAGLAAREVNIWEDPAAAARVRSITGGDETVPTVVVGDLAMVNPSLGDIRRALGERSAHLRP